MKGWTKEMVRVTVETNYPFCNGVTKDEALQLAHDLLCELKQTRKETAEKFARKAKEQFADSARLCEQIDEICKEIAEDE